MARKEYKVITIEEGVLGSIFLGASKLPVRRMEETLNEHGRQGWDVSFMLIEQKRLFLFWTREAAIVTLSRNLD
jgi:hypothetical protein